jgi:hypothetical protein
MHLEDYVHKQIVWSTDTFGPGQRTKGVIDHIKKELREVEEAAPDNLEEWIDVIILALDGAWRSGHNPLEICDALMAKQKVNMRRKWADWRELGDDVAIEHDRSEEVTGESKHPGLQGFDL